MFRRGPGMGQGMQGPMMGRSWRRADPGFGRFGMRRGMGPGRFGMGPRRGASWVMMLKDPAFRERMGITSEQATKIQGQQNAFARTMVRSRADVQVKRMELGELLGAEKTHRAAIEKKWAEFSQAETGMRKAQFDNFLTVRDSLTPEQREMLRTMRRESAARGMMRPGSGPPGPCGRGLQPRRDQGPPQLPPGF